MNSYDYQTPDLASILRTLSGQSSQSLQPVAGASTVDTHYNTSQGTQGGFNGISYVPEQPHITVAPPVNHPYQHLPPTEPSRPEPRVTLEPKQTSKPSVDPKTITSWSPGLRYITKQVAQDEEFAERIKKLIKSQHSHERQWAKGREELLEGRRKREQGRNAINDVL